MTVSLAALVVATAILVAIPGPNVGLIVANSLRYGFGAGVRTVFGTTAGVGIQLVLVVAGMSLLIEAAASALGWVRWAGVAYLVWLGIHTWHAPASDLAGLEATPPLFWQGCALAAVNPKTLLFSASFLPQFLEPGAGAIQFLLIAGVYLLVLLSGDLCWAAFASQARRLFGRYGRSRNRVTGGFLVASGIGLALARRYLEAGR